MTQLWEEGGGGSNRIVVMTELAAHMGASQVSVLQWISAADSHAGQGFRNSVRRYTLRSSSLAQLEELMLLDVRGGPAAGTDRVTACT